MNPSPIFKDLKRVVKGDMNSLGFVDDLNENSRGREDVEVSSLA